MERRYTKEQILEMYLNSIYHGSGAYGVVEAAEIYFGKDLQQLTISEAAILAALPQAPSKLTPFGGDRKLLLERKSAVLNKMFEYSYLTAAEKNEAEKAPLVLRKEKSGIDTAETPHFAVWVRDYLYQKYGENTVNRLGFRVKTSLDLPLQKIAQAIPTLQPLNTIPPIPTP